MLGTKIRAEEAWESTVQETLTRSNNLYWVTLSIFWHPSNPNSYSQNKRSSVRSMLNSLVWHRSYSQLPVTPPEVAAFARCPPLSGSICWLMLITQMRSRTTTTRSSRTPSSPQREGSVCRASSAEERGSRGGEEMDTTVPTQHSATLKKKSHTSPPMVPTPRASSCRRRGASYR